MREYELFHDVEAVSVMEREGVGESRVYKQGQRTLAAPCGDG